jgi:hypothetical protein
VLEVLFSDCIFSMLIASPLHLCSVRETRRCGGMMVDDGRGSRHCGACGYLRGANPSRFSTEPAAWPAGACERSPLSSDAFVAPSLKTRSGTSES